MVSDDATNYLSGQLSRSVFTEVRASAAASVARRYFDRMLIGFTDLKSQTARAADAAGRIAGGAGRPGRAPASSPTASTGPVPAPATSPPARRGHQRLPAAVRRARRPRPGRRAARRRHRAGRRRRRSLAPRSDAAAGPDRAVLRDNAAPIEAAATSIADGADLLREHLDALPALATTATQRATATRAVPRTARAALPADRRQPRVPRGRRRRGRRRHRRAGGPDPPRDRRPRRRPRRPGPRRADRPAGRGRRPAPRRRRRRRPRAGRPARRRAQPARRRRGPAARRHRRGPRGARDLSGGLFRLSTGARQLDDGLVALSDGGHRLAGGLGELSDGASRCPRPVRRRGEDPRLRPRHPGRTRRRPRRPGRAGPRHRTPRRHVRGRVRAVLPRPRPLGRRDDQLHAAAAADPPAPRVRRARLARGARRLAARPRRRRGPGDALFPVLLSPSVWTPRSRWRLYGFLCLTAVAFTAIVQWFGARLGRPAASPRSPC